jgi:hypothetical protein
MCFIKARVLHMNFPHSFPTESISPATTSSEENIQVHLEQVALIFN